MDTVLIAALLSFTGGLLVMLLGVLLRVAVAGKSNPATTAAAKVGAWQSDIVNLLTSIRSSQLIDIPQIQATQARMVEAQKEMTSALERVVDQLRTIRREQRDREDD